MWLSTDSLQNIPDTWFTHLSIWGRSRMPWNECKPMDERLRFIARLLEGEKMAPLCREFGISRVTGYKIFNRYKPLPSEGRRQNTPRLVTRESHKLRYKNCNITWSDRGLVRRLGKITLRKTVIYNYTAITGYCGIM